MLKKISFWQNKRYKNVLFLLLRAPTHHSFTFNMRFLHELKRKVRLSKTLCGILLKLYFVQQNESIL